MARAIGPTAPWEKLGQIVLECQVAVAYVTVMPPTDITSQRAIRLRYRNKAVNCSLYTGYEIARLADYFSCLEVVFHTGDRKLFWFRGLSDIRFDLVPWALRYPDKTRRDTALSELERVKINLSHRIPGAPDLRDDLEWMQVAQHYGFPTRLLDWTENAAVALYFACSGHPKSDALVALFNPFELNALTDPRLPRIFGTIRDRDMLLKYVRLDGKINRRGLRTIAITPTQKSNRIIAQQGMFTLHGSRSFGLDSTQASSLMVLPILKEHKARLASDLEAIGVGEMFLFPEAEHVCKHIRRLNDL